MNFKPITIKKFVRQFKKDNPKSDIKDLKKSLYHFKKLKAQGQECVCGNPIWIIGSAISGMGCFTCITGESDNSEDYEII